MLARNVGRLGAPELRPVVNPFAKITKQSGYLKRCWYFFHVIPTLVFSIATGIPTPSLPPPAATPKSAVSLAKIKEGYRSGLTHPFYCGTGQAR